MPVTPTFPGVYIEEIPSGVRTIAGVATSIAAFVDFFRRGPADKAVQIFNMGDFEREFGGLDKRSEASYAIQQFFLNGGTEAWIVRVAEGAAAADAQVDDVNAGASTALTVKANSPGKWGESVRVQVDNKGTLATEFNLTITEYAASGGRTTIARQEVFRNLSMTASNNNYVQKVVNDPNTGSKIVTVQASGANLPMPNGTLSGVHGSNPTVPATPSISVTITDGTTTATKVAALKFPASPTLPAALPLSSIAPVLESAIRAADPANPAFGGATVTVIGNQFAVLTGPGNPKNRISFANDGLNTTAADLLLTTGTSNLQEYLLGGGAIASTGQLGGTAGNDGSLPGSAALIGDLNAKTGIFALEDVDLFNLLSIPRTSFVASSPSAGELTPSQAQALMTVAINYCEKRRAFFLMDTPKGFDDQQEIKTWLASNSTLRHRNAALFYPRVKVPDPLDEFRLRDFGASGTVAGLFARTDGARGVWKAPAGTEAVLRNVSDLDDRLTDPENGVLNPLAINCLRNFPVYGNVCWGARTLDGSDQQASEWKYIPVRRLALFIEESLYRGTQWVVFEPNDEPLWAQIRLNVGAFMHNLFVQGAFQGTTPREAYFVKCDKETTTQNDINLGIVNIVVGFAPLKPAEFVIIKLQQIAGQIQV